MRSQRGVGLCFEIYKTELLARMSELSYISRHMCIAGERGVLAQQLKQKLPREKFAAWLSFLVSPDVPLPEKKDGESLRDTQLSLALANTEYQLNISNEENTYKVCTFSSFPCKCLPI